MKKYVIVGNGVTGVTAAQNIVQAIKTAGETAAEIHILSSEPHLYYRRPMLWQFIAGEIQEHALYFRPAEWYRERNIQVHLDATAVSLSPQDHVLTLADGSTLSYDRLLLATGGDPLVPPFKGAQREGVFTLRTIKDARAIKAQAAQSRSAVVIGGGLLGLETARSILSPQVQVTVLEVMSHLLPRQLCPDGAGVLQKQLERMELHILTCATTEQVLGDGRVEGVRLQDGRTVQGDMVIVAVGMRSRIELAKNAQLATNRGIIVDEHMCTSDPDIYAAGDAAEFSGIVYGIIPAAMEQAQVAAANMVNPGSAAYKKTMPSTALKVAGIDLTCLGNSNAVQGDGLIIRIYQNESEGIFKKFVIQNGKVTGAVLLGNNKDARAVQQLIGGVNVSAYQDRLFDIDLMALARGQLK